MGALRYNASFLVSLRRHCLAILLLLPTYHCSKMRYAWPSGEVVYRGDFRSPETLRDAGGFLPANSKAAPDSFGLYHHTGLPRMKDSTQYVSTTKSIGVAAIFAGTIPDITEAIPSWVYVIRPTANFIDVKQTLRSYTVHPFHEEFAALGGIRWEQVLGWVVMSTSPYAESQIGGFGRDAAQIMEQVMLEAEFRPNGDYNPALDRSTAAGAVPQLAGFPAGHLAWERLPWKRFPLINEFTLEEYAHTFMELHRNQLRWRGQFPLFVRVDKSVKALTRSVQASMAAEQASAEALEDKRPLSAARKAMRAAKKGAKARLWLERGARALDDHSFLAPEAFYQTESHWRAARKAVAKSHWRAQTLKMEFYRQAAGLMNAQVQLLADESDQFRGIEADTMAAMMDYIERLQLQLSYGLNLHTREIASLQAALEAGASARAVTSANLIWLRFREVPSRAVLRELAALRGEHDALQSSAAELSLLAQEAKSEGAAFLAAVDQINAGSRGSEVPNKSASCHSWIEIVASIVTEIISLLPTPAAPVLNVLKWGRRAWSALKFARRASKISKSINVPLSRHVGSLKELKEASQRLEKLLENTKLTSTTSSVIPRKWKSMNDVFHDLDPVAAAHTQDVRSVSFENMVKELDTVQVPVDEPSLSQEGRSLEDLLKDLDQMEIPQFIPQDAKEAGSHAQSDKLREPATLARRQTYAPSATNETAQQMDDISDMEEGPSRENLVDLILFRCSWLLGGHVLETQSWSAIDEVLSSLESTEASAGENE